MRPTIPFRSDLPPASSENDGATFVPPPPSPPQVAAVGYPPRPRHPFGRLRAFVRAGAEALLGSAGRRCVRCHSPRIVPAAPTENEVRWAPLYCLFDCADCGHRWAQYQPLHPFV